jgi:beta-galactosidase
LKIQPQADGFDYLDNFKQIHQAFVRLGIGTDVINWTAAISPYRLVVAPFLFLENDAVVEKLREYVAQGGTVLLTTRSGVKNMNNVCLAARLPGGLSEIAGTIVDEYDPVGNDQQGILLRGKSQASCSQWCDILSPTTAETIATYTTEFFAQRAAITRNNFGQGVAYYVGCIPDDDGYRILIGDIVAELGLNAVDDLPSGVELSIRSGDGRRLLFVLNLSKEAAQVELAVPVVRSVLTDQPVSQPLVLEPMGVEVLLLK